MDTEYIEKQWPNFTVTCDKCGSKSIYIRDTRGWSELSGGWGEVSLVCDDCGNEADIVENY